ncbi:uncharacterized protein LOC112594319 [Melanaphis sacchari]|uniref:uncharacterized protein LOC112594319 n=1 Tax=Melanaphis sacchari TaxID=742174 RepID=UPI000DC148B1|nr:uncharacterized protein LOC112594319 [Melanaphis sacchari]
MVNFQLRNTSRVVVPYEIRLPRELLKHAKLSHSKGYLRAESSLEVFIRLRFKYEVLLPDECKTYFDAKSGVLNFPVRVYSSNCKKFHEVRVLAVVTTPFGLKLTPDTLDFGTVNTMETVVRSVMLANHSRTKMEYGFLKLPERVSVHPSAFGTIFSGEQIRLHLHYSPNASDLPQNVYTHDDNFVLTCNTVTGVNAEICPFQDDATTQTYETINEVINEQISSTVILNEKSAVGENEIKELNHGADKIQFSILNDKIEVCTFDDKNAILKEATLRCHAKIHDVPVELSVQKIIFGKTHLMSYSVFKIDLRASNLASITERNINAFPDFKIRFEFISNDSTIEFKPRNGILHSKEVITINVLFRPKFDDEVQSIYEECLNSEVMKLKVDQILKDKNAFINQVYTNKPFFHEQIKIFETNKTFFSLMFDTMKIIPAVCFVQFINQKSKEVNETLEVSSETMRLHVMVSGSGLGPSCTITPDDMFNVIQNTHKHANKALIFRVTNTSGTNVRFNLQMEWTRERSESITDDEVYEFVEKLRVAERVDPERRVAMASQFEGEEWVVESANTEKSAFDLGNGGRPLWFRLDPNESRYVQVTLTLPRHNRQLDENGGGGGCDDEELLESPFESTEELLRSPGGAEEDFFKSPDGGFRTELAKLSRDFVRNDYGRTATALIASKRRVYAAKFNVHVGHSVLRQFYVFGFVDVDKTVDS